jgi:hypothetical protein
MLVRFFHDRTDADEHAVVGNVVFQLESDYIPRVGDEVAHPFDAWFPDPFWVSNVQWCYDANFDSKVDLAFVDVTLTPVGEDPILDG